MTPPKTLLKTGILKKEDIQIIQQETSKFFDNKEFYRSTIKSSKNPLDERHRKSYSFFPKLHQIPETVIITKLIVNKFLNNYIYTDLPTVQLLKYGIDNYYHWHIDSSETSLDEDGGIRVMTISINLNTDYEGGGLELKYKGELYKQEKEVGAFCMFPSFCSHRALTVTSGERKAMTFWFTSPRENYFKLKELYDSEI